MAVASADAGRSVSSSRETKAVLSRSSEYAIRALTFLAQQQGEEFHLARDMAQQLGIPAPFLGKVLQPLVARGILFSQRGRSGGFRLAQPANKVTLLQIVDTQESLGKARQCVLGQPVCTDEFACPLHAEWRHTADTFLTRLNNTTLQEVVEFCVANPNCRYPVPVFFEPLGASEPMPYAAQDEGGDSLSQRG
jgi:Rrf2 family protein